MLEEFYKLERRRQRIARVRHIIIWYILVPLAVLHLIYRIWLAATGRQ